LVHKRYNVGENWKTFMNKFQNKWITNN
jgi:hypothetical protein